MFLKDVHYIQRPKVLGCVWRFESLHRSTTDLGIDSHQHIEFLDCEGKKWAELEGRYWTTEPRYAWNGCSPKICLGLWMGTPDFQATIEASFIHDQLCQFFNTPEFPFSKFQVDQIFFTLMKRDKFPLARLYYQAVNHFGDYEIDEPCETSRIILD